MSNARSDDQCELKVSHNPAQLAKTKPCTKRKNILGSKAKHFCLDNMLPMLEASLKKKAKHESSVKCTSKNISANTLVQSTVLDEISKVICDVAEKKWDPIKDINTSTIDCHNDQSNKMLIPAEDSNKVSLPFDKHRKKKNNSSVKKHSVRKVKLRKKPKAKSSASYKDKYLSLESLPTPLYEENSSEDKPFVCPVCQSCFKQAFPLKRHMLIHSAVKPFFCTVCDFRCNDGSNLRKHMQTHAEKKKFSCPDCDYTCGRPDHLRNHRAKHTGFYQYECGICGYGCNQSSDLTRHMSVHVGNKPFKCEHCSFSTSRRCTLKIHVQARHTDTTSFVCGVCSFTLSSALGLEKHMQLHEREKMTSA